MNLNKQLIKLDEKNVMNHIYDYLIQKIKSLVKRGFYYVGFDVQYRKVCSDFLYSFVYFCNKHSVMTVLDIGANRGQFAESILRAGYLGEIISVEPLKDAYKVLVDKASFYDNWQVVGPVAIAKSNGTAVINISGNSVSSSILNMRPRHIINSNNSVYIGSDLVETKSINNLINTYVTDVGYLALKLDVQGLEGDILESIENYYERIAVICIEVSFVELYENQWLFDKTYNFIKEQGYEILTLEEGLKDSESSAVLQADFIFINKKIFNM